ncbi:MAG: pyridoxamine 5'-phosphate oxidase family protein [Candidatus Bathyarchaeota archaeon]|nr:pyridoxamine 5'-phosphate oxidase family protein [Candidatus Bathyarchaeota archaeon]
MSYTQSPHLTSDEIESFLQEAKIARFCSYNKDGTIHAAPVWYKYENGKMVIGTPLKSRKARNVRRNGSVTVLVDVEGPPTRGVIMYGKAELKELTVDDMIPLGMSIFRRYMPEDETQVYAEGLGKISKWVKITVTPFRFASFDYSKDELYRKATQGLL